MEYVLTAAQMKQCDQNTIQMTGIPSAVLMERAALAVADVMEQEELDLSSVLVLCGSGNNGGDGFAIARILQERKRKVETVFVGKASSMTEETARQKQICENCNIKCVSNLHHGEYTTIVDAMFGIGLSRDVQGEYAQWIEWVNAQPAKVVAVDLPSGICADSGRIMGTAVHADITVTFAYRKPGQLLYPGAQYCGKLICRDIGIRAERFADLHPEHFLFTREDRNRIPARMAYSNKGTYGKVLLIAGSDGMCGAGCLAAKAAYRSGCGLVRIFTPECNRIAMQSYLPEAMVTCYEKNGPWKEQLMQAMAWADVAAIGPGLGQSLLSEQILEYVVKNFEKSLVIDADGLNLLAKNKNWLEEHTQEVIMTPHIGEMMRLTDRKIEEIQQELIWTAKQFAQKYQVICVLKDARTVVTDGKKVYINISGNSGMAVGGSGDVLTGVITGLLAQRMEVFEAASVGTYLHGLAGDAARDQKGSYGMLASDVADFIGEVLKEQE